VGSVFRPIFISEGGENPSSWAFIVKTEVRSQEKGGSCMFSWTGAATIAMVIYRYLQIEDICLDSLTKAAYIQEGAS